MSYFTYCSIFDIFGIIASPIPIVLAIFSQNYSLIWQAPEPPKDSISTLNRAILLAIIYASSSKSFYILKQSPLLIVRKRLTT